MKQNTIKSVHHQLGTYHQQRTALTPYDNKRFILEDNITTRAIGHYLNSPLPYESVNIVWGEDINLNHVNLIDMIDIDGGDINWGKDINLNDINLMDIADEINWGDDIDIL